MSAVDYRPKLRFTKLTQKSVSQTWRPKLHFHGVLALLKLIFSTFPCIFINRKFAVFPHELFTHSLNATCART